MSNNNNLKLVSPVAPCKWVNIKTPHPEYDVYQINLLLPADSEEAKKWMEDIDGWMADEKKASGSKKITEYPPYKEDGENIIFKFKQKAVFKGRGGDERAVTILVVDAQMKPCNVDIGWGSKVKVSYSPVPYTVNGKSGVTMYFNAVQIIELVEYEAQTGFEVEDGYKAEETPENPFVAQTSNAETADSADF